jgi:CARDB
VLPDRQPCTRRPTLKHLAALSLAIALSTTGHAAQVTVINMIPKALSGETNQDSEPNLAVNPANPAQIAGSAFTPSQGFCRTNLAPIFVSTDGGDTWVLNCIVSSDSSGMTSDITVRFAETNLYAGILRRPGAFRLNVLRTNNFVSPTAMAVLLDRRAVDQPYVQASRSGVDDRVYVGDNACCPPGPGGRTATIDQSLNAQILAPIFNSIVVEARTTAGQDGPPIRPAVHSDGTIYAAFYHWTNRVGDFNPNATIRTDVVVVRDDNGGAGATPFTSLVDAGDGLPGVRVVRDRVLPWANTSQPNFGQERFVGSNLSIAVDPRNSSTVYIAWADRVSDNDYTLHVRRSLDRGATWSADIRTITNATNPALAINSEGRVGFLYQQIVPRSPAGGPRWVTRFESTNDGFATHQDSVLATVPADSPVVTFLPYIGDYVHVMAIGKDFFGIFSANNMPDLANFPNGVVYQRNANFQTKTLLATDGVTKVDVSIDPFFFNVAAETTPQFEYAVKFICGKSDERGVVAPGLYFTAINVHNPASQSIAFKKKFATALPREKPGPVSRLFNARLGPDEAFEIDCPDILKHTQARSSFLKGFAVLQSEHELDVVAVYTAAGATRQVETLEIERVPARGGKAPGRPDLTPVPDPRPGVGFCRRGNDGGLIVKVKNAGTGNAGPSKVTVEFTPGGSVSQVAPTIGANTSLDVAPFPVPGACFNPDCHFKIAVDSANQIDESDEGNNEAQGVCIG